jgi:hypothetical protein
MTQFVKPLFSKLRLLLPKQFRDAPPRLGLKSWGLSASSSRTYAGKREKCLLTLVLTSCKTLPDLALVLATALQRSRPQSYMQLQGVILLQLLLLLQL